MRCYFFHISFLFFFVFLSQAQSILVTGGAGFIGSHVAERLLARGDDVYVIDNMNDFYNPMLKEHNISVINKSVTKKSGTFYFFKMDLCDIDELEAFFESHSIDSICHLAARAGVQPSIEDPVLYTQANVVATINVLEMAKKYKIDHLVIASSSSVYGSDTPVPFSEEYKADKPCSPYAATKRAVELLASTYHHLFDISCTCLRFFTVYGPRGRVDMSPFKFVNAIYNGTPLTLCGDGSIVRDYTYISDIVDGVVSALDTSLGFEVINLGRGEPITLNDFIHTIETVMDKKAHIVHVPVKAGDVPITHADITKAQKLLGYAPHISVQEGMENMYKWYEEEFLENKDLVRGVQIQ